MKSSSSPAWLFVFSLLAHTARAANQTCKVLAGDPAFPSPSELAAFNASVDGRLLAIVPSAEYCNDIGGCSEAQWTSGNFRVTIPGSMMSPNWEQDYTSNPPSLCLQNSTSCGQGDVPNYGVNATTAQHVQTAVSFAAAHNLKVVVKSSGHDYLGRSTDRGAFLIWVHHLTDTAFTDAFSAGGENYGSAVTVGSGSNLSQMYAAAKAAGKIFVGGNALTVAAAGGYVQGAGHSVLSPTYGLAADNALQFQVVLGNGSLVTANEHSNQDLFFALRGGGPGAWGVITSATFRTFPTFNMTFWNAAVVVSNTSALGQLAGIHAAHIFDTYTGGEIALLPNPTAPGTWTFDYNLYFPCETDVSKVNATVKPFLDAVVAAGFEPIVTISTGIVNDLLLASSDSAGTDLVIGSRIIPESAYRAPGAPQKVAETFQGLLDKGANTIVCILASGPKVAENADIDNAVLPAWRTSRTHCLVFDFWLDSTPLDAVAEIKTTLTNTHVPMLASLAQFPATSGPTFSYSNEADANEPDWQETFYGPNYARLSAIKKAYDPQGMFIVKTGVGSEEWDADRVCKVA